jgi:hypothetical protein
MIDRLADWHSSVSVSAFQVCIAMAGISIVEGIGEEVEKF